MRVWDHIAALKAGADVYQAPFGADVRMIAEASARRGGVNAYIARDDRHAFMAAELSRFVRPDLRILRFPAWDCLPYDRVSPTATIASQRCATMAQLASTPDETALVITTASALIQRVPPRSHMAHASINVTPGDDYPPEQVISYLLANGYSRTSTVREPGEFSIRGGIVDIFPSGFEDPIRLDFFGYTLESIRTFDPETQRSSGTRDDLTLAPVSEVDFSDQALANLRENYLKAFGPPAGDPVYESARERIRRQGMEHLMPLFYDQVETLFDYFGEKALIGVAAGVVGAAEERIELATEYHATRVRTSAGAHVLPPERLYLPSSELDARLTGSVAVKFTGLDAPPDRAAVLGRAKPSRNFAPERASPNAALFEAVADHLANLEKSRQKVVLAAWTEGSASRLKTFLEDHGHAPLRMADSVADCAAGEAVVSALPIEDGFEDDDLSILTEQDILGEKLARPRKRRSSAAVIAEAATLSRGDLVVHVDHGVGRYDGLVTIEVQDAPHDCLQLLYAGGDKILLPVENVELVSRYGADGGDSILDRLGGAGWQTRKARARKKIMDMAEDLIRLAAEREMKTAPRLNPADGSFGDFSARFPHEETDDQLAAIADVVSDLSSGKPMDRLICGDVGFGKTEVALRAAFLVAMSGLQVALIAPTTLLARQHFRTFEERFAGWPLKVRQLSRMVPGKQAASTREEIRSGECDIVIGTHALVSNQVEFKRLGLLIIDEEQRFGVKHKERLKEMRSDVHVLTMSATPIPRTLQMSLAGIRDLSIIATPPVDRLAVRTFQVEFDPITIKEALLRERYRGGQSYIVAPRVSDLPFLERFLREDIPELTHQTAHGQMTPTELEDAMSAFYDGKVDVLLSTTIIESGLDIPRANTLIVHRADMFGLAQLYQLRGRVGRAKLRAYAFLTIPEEGLLTEGAAKRLRVLQSLDSLGAGFMLASHDLDMRGGGNLLGEAQSGHIREVGVDLYQSMLEDAIKALRTGATEVSEEWSPQIDVGAAVLIPETYVPDLATRLSLYRRLASIETEPDREAFAAELIDRFGEIPEETQQLLQIAALKAICKALGVSKVSAGPKGVLLGFRQDAPVDGAAIVAFVHQRPGELKLRPDAKLVANGHWPDPMARLKAVVILLRQLRDSVALPSTI